MVLSTAGGNTGNGNRGALIYNGADTTATSATAARLGRHRYFRWQDYRQLDHRWCCTCHEQQLIWYGGPRHAHWQHGRRQRPTNNGVVELDGTAGDILTSENFRIETRSLANGTPQIRNVAGNNTIGFVATLYDGDVAGGADSWFIESAGGTLTINGGVSNSFAGTTTVYLQGGGDGVIAGTTASKTTAVF